MTNSPEFAKVEAHGDFAHVVLSGVSDPICHSDWKGQSAKERAEKFAAGINAAAKKMVDEAVADERARMGVGIDQVADEAVRAEREACAKIVEGANPKRSGSIIWRRGFPELCDQIVSAIRARGRPC